MNSAESEISTKELFSEKKIFKALGEYLSACEKEDTHGNSNNSKQKNQKQTFFPNFAGFCRYMKMGTEEFCELAYEHPRLLDRILAVLEDEALNSSLAASVLVPYLKRRLGYDVPSASEKELPTQFVFEHDIFTDGE